MLRRAIRGAVLAASRTELATGAVTAVERLLPPRPTALTVLTYHRVDTLDARPDLLPSLISASPERFAEQMRLIASLYQPVSIAAVLQALDGMALPPRALLVTFDDGYRDFARHAWPVMRALGIPATLFVATSFAEEPSRRFWWDRVWAAMVSTARTEPLRSSLGTIRLGTTEERRASFAQARAEIKALPHDVAMTEVDQLVADLGEAPRSPSPAVLGWDELRALAAEGVTLAPHTRSHALLDRLSLERATEEISGSTADLERVVGAVPRVFAYPSGAHGGDAVEAARRAGMTLAFTTLRGGQDLRRVDPLRLRRINVGGQVGLGLIAAQVAWASRLDARRAQPG